MEVDLHEFIAEHLADCGSVAVCANLPYYITTPVIMKLLESKVPFASVTVMIQREVADRLTAPPGSPDYGAITASCAYYGKAEKLFTVSAGNFMPPPKVDSAVVRIDLYGDNKPVVPMNEKTLFSVITAAFAQRRKTLLNTLSASMPDIEKNVISDILVSCGIDPRIRGEELSVAEFAVISDKIYEYRNAD